MLIKFRLVCTGFVLVAMLVSCFDVRTTAIEAANRPDSAKTIAPTALPTSIPITIPTACLPSAQAGDWPARTDSNDWSAKVAAVCLPSPSAEEIIRVLFTVWLAHFQAADIPEEYRIEKFAIVSIDDVEISSFGADKSPVGFTCMVTFLVLPSQPVTSNPAGWWVAGSGAINEHGWISKQFDARVDQSGDFYKISVSPHGAA